MKIKHWQWWVGIVLSVIFVVAWVASNRVNGFATAVGCDDSVIIVVESPDKRSVAYIFRRACGATASDSIQANVQPNGTPLDSGIYLPFFVADDTATLRIEWRTSLQLVVHSLTSERIYRRDPVSQGIGIEYR